MGYFCDAVDFTGKPCLLTHVQWSSVNLHLHGQVFLHVEISKYYSLYNTAKAEIYLPQPLFSITLGTFSAAMTMNSFLVIPRNNNTSAIPAQYVFLYNHTTIHTFALTNSEP